MQKSNRAILVAESDLHGGSKLGLLNPETKLLSETRKEYYPSSTETQINLWSIRENGRKEVLHLAGKSPIVILQTGDVNQGMAYDVNDNLRSQVTIAYMNILPWLQVKNVVAYRADEGTPIHSFGDGSAEALLVDKIKDNFPKFDAKVVSHGLSDICGITVDHAHHGPHYGIREWTRGNIALYYLRDLMMKDILRGKKPPDLVLRGHYHSVVEVFNRMRGPDDKNYRSWLWVLPSLCGMNGYATKITQSEYEITNGIVAWEIIDGRIREAFEFTETMDLREVETII